MRYLMEPNPDPDAPLVWGPIRRRIAYTVLVFLVALATFALLHV